jgi:cytidylate kinase
MKHDAVILSGLPGSGKSTLANELSESYGWEIYSVGRLWRERYSELHPDGCMPFEEYWRRTTLEDNLEVNRIARGVFERGNVIGDSRYSIYCKDLPALLAFVTADLETRAGRAAAAGKYDGRAADDIKRTLMEREADEVRVGRALFGEGYDYRDARHYHVVLNSGMLTVDEEVAVIDSLMV